MLKSNGNDLLFVFGDPAVLSPAVRKTESERVYGIWLQMTIASHSFLKSEEDSDFPDFPSILPFYFAPLLIKNNQNNLCLGFHTNYSWNPPSKGLTPPLIIEYKLGWLMNLAINSRAKLHHSPSRMKAFLSFNYAHFVFVRRH